MSKYTDIFNFNSYKKFVIHWVSQQPKKGYGQYKKMSEHLGIGSVIISQVFKGDRNLSEEQGIELGSYLGLLDIEQDYFLQLIRFERASTYKLKEYIKKDIEELRQSASRLEERLKPDFQMSDEKKATFFSQWQYSAIRLATDIPQYRSLQHLSQLLDIEVNKVKVFVDFLIENNLCIRENGEVKMGPQLVYLEPSSPYILSRHRSWRVKAFAEMENNKEDDLFFTSPIVCSKKTAQKIRRDIVDLIENVLSDIKPSPSETLTCLNIDWFHINEKK